MTDDPFNILGSEFDAPPTFEAALQTALQGLQETTARFEALYAEVPEDWYSEDEWEIVDRAATEAAEAVERAEEGYVAVQYDGHAWYRIMESFEAIRLRLESAIGTMQRVRDRSGPDSRVTG